MMKKLICLIFILGLTVNAYAVKEYATRFGTGTALEVYSPNNIPTLDNLSDVNTSGVITNDTLVYNGAAWGVGAGTTYPGAGIPLSTGSAWGTSITNNSSNWDTAYTDRLKWDGGATGLVAATGRTSLGLVIGTDVQAQNANLASLAGLTYASASFVKMTAAGTFGLDTTVLGTLATLSSVDISSNTNLAGDSEIVLTGDALSIASTITRDTELSAYQTVLTNSAGLLAALNDETGTGLAVFGTSPTFTTQITTPKIVSAGDMTFDAVNAAANSTVYILNSNGTYTADLNVEGDLVVTDVTVSTGGTLQLGQNGTDGLLKIYSEQGATDYISSLYANTAMTSAASFYLPADEPAATSFLNMTTGGVMGYVASSTIPTTSNNLSAFAATTSAQLYGVISDETGSASGSPLVVFNVNPTLTGATLAGVLNTDNNWISGDGGAEGIYIGDTGSVGIGTTGPTVPLQIENSSTFWRTSTAGVAHGMTDIAPTNITGSGEAFSATYGGFLFTGLSGNSATTVPLYFRGLSGSASPTDVAIRFRGGKKDGTSYGLLADNEQVIGFENYTTRLVTILGNGSVGIGTTLPNQALTVENSISLKEIASANADTAAYGQIWVKTATPNTLWFTDDAGTDFQLGAGSGDVATDAIWDAAGDLVYGTGANTAARLAAGATTTILVGGGAAAPVWTTATGTGAPVRAGSPTFTTQITTPIIDLTGGQIAFPSSQAASAGANTLDDYEEGTWNSGLTCSTSGTISLYNYDYVGNYVKIGRMVTVSVRVGVESVSSPVGELTLTGLPFTCGTSTSNEGGISIASETLQTTAITQIVGYVIPETTTIKIRKFSAGVAGALAGDVKADTYFRICATYFVD